MEFMLPALVGSIAIKLCCACLVSQTVATLLHLWSLCCGSYIFLYMQCPIEDGTLEHRVCIFEDVIVWDSYIHYLYTGGHTEHFACLLSAPPS